MDPLTAEHPEFRLITLGRISLATPAGEDADLARRPRKLALLAVIALSPTPLTRATLAEMFWGDEDAEKARHSLSDALSDLRRVLGRGAISGRSEIVELETRGRLAVDALELQAAFNAADFQRVQALYGGRFLGTLAVDGSASFERWVAEMREHYASMHARAMDATTSAQPPVTQHRSRRRLFSTLIGAAAAAALIGILVARVASGNTPPATTNTPVVALTDVFTDPADTSLAWLAEGLKQMIAADVGRLSSAGMVAPAVVREAAMNAPRRDSLSARESIGLARRLHANWAASGSVSRRQGAYVVGITLRDVDHPGATHAYEVTGEDILAVADKAAAKMLSALNATGAGARLSDVETANTDAYRHFIRSEEMRAEGRYADELHELDAAIAADSGFTSAIVARLKLADAESFVPLDPLLERVRPRMQAWDLMSLEVFEANHRGDPKRAERVARAQVERFPRDPRSIRAFAELLMLHAEYQAAETVYTRLVALDSLPMEGSGPCWACEGYLGLTDARRLRGEYAGEIDAARHWSALRPASAAAWLSLANALDLNGDTRAAETALARYRQLTGERTFDPYTGRMFVMARRYDEAEEYARRYLASGSAPGAYDLLQTVQRERGQFRAAIATFKRWSASGPLDGTELVYAHTLATLHDDARARAVFESTWHPPKVQTPLKVYGTRARGYAWNHALEADATWEHADTATLRALGDSIQRVGALSYYARDWTIFHHVRGLVAERQGRLEDARREFELALSKVPGFTRSNVELARVNVALGAPARAIDALRRGYHEPLDAMGRYAPRSEMDFQMALAFAKAGQEDSARTYGSYVRAAWVRADPEFVRRLAQLP